MIFTKNDYNYQNITYESGFIFDYWACSSQEPTLDGEKFSGAYPKGFLKRLKPAFAAIYPTDPNKILHVCAGRISPLEGMRLDANPKYNPDFLGNAENFHEWIDAEYLSYFDFQLADPPYNSEASLKYYGMPLLNKFRMMKGMIATTKLGGYIGLLDQNDLAPTPKQIKSIAKVAVSSIPNLDLRRFTLYQKISEL